jgi:putative MATE family efflux protein
VENSISYKKILRISIPIIISGVAQNVVNVTDTMFLGKISNVALGAAGNAGIFYFILVITGMGFTTGAQIIIGRRNGEQNFNQIGRIFDHCIYFITPLAVLLFFFIKYWSTPLLEVITQSDNILNAAAQYLNYRAYGIFFAYLNFTFIAFYVGTTKTSVLIYTTIIMMVVNVFLDYGLIFGNFGLPKMGIEGAAIASVISEIAALVFFIIYTLKMIDLKKYNLFGFKAFDKTILKRILNIGSPMMFQNFLSLSSWFIFFMIIEKLGEKELAISHIIRSIYMVLMIPLFGFSSATNTLVSNLIGQGNSDSVLNLIKKITLLSLLSTSIMLLFNLFFAKEMIGFYTSDQNLIIETIPTLNVISATMFFFSIAFILFNGVSGTGNTRTSLLIEIITIVIYLVATYYIAIPLKSSLPVVWCSEFIYFGLLATMSFSYLKWGNWKNREI